ncbi:hypothetical protein JKF63_03484 [Porcisia hertigi]|uniref:Uncharacterized protein n=1 Tax=Porcisia hertigi TaxID=2761500 RepID=A0A836L832_9TRYP|nr:hypothetical protein JKF63_03484 [Porcisia hertigi]
MRTDERFFEALFGFAEGGYIDTRRSLLQRCTFEAVHTHTSRGHRRVLKERALFHHPHLPDGRLISSGWHSTPTVAELRAETVSAVRMFELKHPGLLSKVALPDRVCPTLPTAPCSVRCAHVTGEVGRMHNSIADGLFQAASQFNLLEFMSPAVTPEDGLQHYLNDRTQGPACALACVAGTAYRNYLLHPDFFSASGTVPGVEGPDEAARGQLTDRQVNMLDNLAEYLTREHGSGSGDATAVTDAVGSTFSCAPALAREHFFKVRNGYFFHEPQIASLTARLQHIAASVGISITDVEEELVSRLRIGLVEDATVTLPLHHSPLCPVGDVRLRFGDQAEKKVLCTLGTDVVSEEEVHNVTQTYNSALSLPLQDQCTPLEWSGIAALSRIILRGTYEATLLAGVQHTLRRLEQQMSFADASLAEVRSLSLPPIFLTKVGGGVFRNDGEWIASGIASAVHRVAALGVPLDVRLVHFREVEGFYRDYFPSWPILD